MSENVIDRDEYSDIDMLYEFVENIALAASNNVMYKTLYFP